MSYYSEVDQSQLFDYVQEEMLESEMLTVHHSVVYFLPDNTPTSQGQEPPAKVRNKPP
jgi:hypothetical protein